MHPGRLRERVWERSLKKKDVAYARWHIYRLDKKEVDV